MNKYLLSLIIVLVILNSSYFLGILRMHPVKVEGLHISPVYCIVEHYKSPNYTTLVVKTVNGEMYVVIKPSQVLSENKTPVCIVDNEGNILYGCDSELAQCLEERLTTPPENMLLVLNIAVITTVISIYLYRNKRRLIDEVAFILCTIFTVVLWVAIILVLPKFIF